MPVPNIRETGAHPTSATRHPRRYGGISTPFHRSRPGHLTETSGAGVGSLPPPIADQIMDRLVFDLAGTATGVMDSDASMEFRRFELSKNIVQAKLCSSFRAVHSLASKHVVHTLHGVSFEVCIYKQIPDYSGRVLINGTRFSVCLINFVDYTPHKQRNKITCIQ